MDVESKIEHGSPFIELAQITVGRKDKNFTRRKLNVEFIRAGLVLGSLDQFADPAEPLFGSHAVALHPFVAPMSRHSTFGHLVHAFGADLYLDPTALGGHDRRVQRFVAVRFGNRNPVAHTVWIGCIKIGHDRVDRPAKSFLLLTRAIDHDPDRKKVVHFVETDVHPLHLTPDRIDRLGAALEVVLKFLLPHLLLDGSDESLDEHFAFGRRIFQATPDIIVILRFEVFERNILQFRFNAVKPQFVSDLRIQVQTLPRFLLPFFFREHVQRPHHLEPVGKLDEDHPRIGRIGDDQLAEIIHLIFGGFGIDVRNVAQPFQNTDTLFAVMTPDTVQVHQFQPDDIVQQG